MATEKMFLWVSIKLVDNVAVMRPFLARTIVIEVERYVLHVKDVCICTGRLLGQVN